MLHWWTRLPPSLSRSLSLDWTLRVGSARPLVLCAPAAAGTLTAQLSSALPSLLVDTGGHSALCTALLSLCRCRRADHSAFLLSFLRTTPFLLLGGEVPHLPQWSTVVLENLPHRSLDIQGCDSHEVVTAQCPIIKS